MKRTKQPTRVELAAQIDRLTDALDRIRRDSAEDPVTIAYEALESHLKWMKREF